MILIHLIFSRFVAGIMNREKMHGFELMLWRLCRGNVFLKTAEIPEAIEDAQTVKNYFNYYLAD